MTTKFLKLFLALLLVLLAFAASAPAQTLIVPTTLSATLADGKTTVLAVTSATGINAPAFPSANQLPNTATDLYIDHELMEVRAVSGTSITVRRGISGTRGVAHVKGALVFFSAPQNFVQYDPQSELQGGCTRGTFPADVLPKINILTGVISDCLGGTWVNSDNTPWPPFKIQFPNPGGTAYTSLNTSGTTTVAGTTYCAEVNLTYNKLLTGIGVLAGTTVGTDKWISILYDSAGNLLTSSATAGTADGSTASSYVLLPFTAKYFAVGPAQYFACVMSNGTTDNIRMVVTGTQDALLTKSFTGVFGTLTSLTVPTTFTTAVGPYTLFY